MATLILLVTYLLTIGILTIADASLCQPGWSPYDGNCYRLFSDVREGIVSARKVCRKYRAQVAIPDDQSEVDFLLTLMDATQFYYIGINDNEVEGVWRSFDGCKVDFLPWRAGEPGTSIWVIENYAIIDTGGTFRDVLGNSHQWIENGHVKYICEIQNKIEHAIGPKMHVSSDDMRTISFTAKGGRFLHNLDYATITARRTSICAARCLNDWDICVSYNYNSDTKVCILNAGNHHDTSNGLLPNADNSQIISDINKWTYYHLSNQCG